jgi:hypothetical protein
LLVSPAGTFGKGDRFFRDKKGALAMQAPSAPDRVASHVGDLANTCQRIQDGAASPGDVDAVMRLVQGAAIDAILDGAKASQATRGSPDFAALIQRYARYWTALDRNSDALAAVGREASAWPPTVVDATMAYIRVSEWAALAMVRALARDEARSDLWLAEASAPERLVSLLGSAIARARRRRSQRAPLASANGPHDAASVRPTRPYVPTIDEMVSVLATTASSGQPRDLPTGSFFGQSQAFAGSIPAHPQQRQVVQPYAGADNTQQLYQGSPSGQDAAWWARVCHTSHNGSCL